MKSQACHLLLVDGNEEDERILRRSLDRIETVRWTIKSLESDVITIARDEIPANVTYSIALRSADPEQGWQNLQAIRSRYPVAAIVVLTDLPDLGRAALERGADDYLVRDELSADALERSLRLTRTIAQTRACVPPHPTHCHDLAQINSSLFQLLVQNIEAVFWIATPDMRQAHYISPMYERIWGLSPKSVAHDLDLLWDIMHPDDRDEIQACIQQWLDEGCPDCLEVEYRIAIGDNVRWVHERIFPARDENGTIVYLCGLGEEITDRKRAEAQHQQREALLDTIVSNAPIILYALDRDGILTFLDGKGLESIQTETANSIGRSVFQRYRDYPIVLDNMRRVLAGEQRTWVLEVGDRIFENRAVPLRDSDNRLDGAIGVAIDITARERAEAQLRYRSIVETALARVSRELTTDEAIDLDRLLEHLGRAVETNCVYLGRCQADNTLEILHQWCNNPNHTCPRQCLQHLSVSSYPWWFEQLQRDRDIVASRLDTLPSNANAEKVLLGSFNISSVLAVPIRDRQGKLWGTIGFNNCMGNERDWSVEDAQLLRVAGEIIHNYLARRQAREQLQASEALYAGMFDRSADGMFLVDVLDSDRFVYEAINPTQERLWGKSAAEVAGKTPAQVFPPEIATEVEARYATCIDTGEPICYETTIESQNERAILVPIRDSSGRIAKLQGSVRDVTAQKRAEAERQRQVQYQQLLASLTLKIRQSLCIETILETTVTELQALFQADRVLFFRLDSDRLGKVVSEAAAPGISSMRDRVIIDEYCRKQCARKHRQGEIIVVDDVERAALDPCYLDFLRCYRIRANAIVPILFGDWESNDILPAGSQPFDEPVLWGLLCVQQCHRPRTWTPREIELLQQLADRVGIALYQANLLDSQTRYARELARSNAELEQFAYVASHDLQEPLRTVASYAKLLSRRYGDRLDAKADKFIHYIVEGSDRMQALVNDLLLYSRLSTQPETCEPIDCNWAVSEAIANLHAAIRKSRATIVYEGLPTAIADASQFIQLFQNLIGNAIKYSHPDRPPVVRLSASLQDGEWCFAVADNGIGIEAKYRSRIFQIFQRLHARDEYSGTGIGLAICHKIVERHGGRIWVDSEPGCGSTFYFTLPDRQD
jgi:PAS domain S-box-containing protein